MCAWMKGGRRPRRRRASLAAKLLGLITPRSNPVTTAIVEPSCSKPRLILSTPRCRARSVRARLHHHMKILVRRPALTEPLIHVNCRPTSRTRWLRAPPSTRTTLLLSPRCATRARRRPSAPRLSTRSASCNALTPRRVPSVRPLWHFELGAPHLEPRPLSRAGPGGFLMTATTEYESC